MNNIEVMEPTPPEKAEEMDAKAQLEALRDQMLGDEEMEVQLREAAAEGDERAQFTLELQERVSAFIRDTVIPMSEKQEWDALNAAQDSFVKTIRDLARAHDLSRGEAKDVAKQTDKVIDLFEEMVKEENEPGLARSLLAELWYLVPFAGPATQIVEAKLGHDLKGKKLTAKQKKWRELEGKVWLAADFAGGIGVEGRIAEAGVKATAREGAKIAGEGVAKGVGKGLLHTGAGIQAGKVFNLGKAVKEERKVMEGALRFAKEERSAAGLLDDAAIEVGAHGMDVVLGPSKKTARQLMEEREKLAATIEVA